MAPILPRLDGNDLEDFQSSVRFSARSCAYADGGEPSHWAGNQLEIPDPGNRTTGNGELTVRLPRQADSVLRNENRPSILLIAANIKHVLFQWMPAADLFSGIDDGSSSNPVAT